MARQRAVAYTRLYSDRLADVREFSEAAEAYCDSTGIQLAAVLVDLDKTDGHLDLDHRAAGRQLMSLMGQKQLRARTIVLDDMSRTFKDTVDAGRQFTKWDDKGKRVVILNAGEQTSLTLDGRESRGALLAIRALAGIEKALIHKRITTGLHQRKVRGRVHGGTPYGHDREGSLLVENAMEQQVIKRMLYMRRCGLSYRDIADELNQEGVTAKQGGQWIHTSVADIVRRNGDR